MAIIPHPRDIQVAVVDWFDDRFPFTRAVDEALYQRVPNFANAFYYCFGGMVFILIVFQLVTDMFLAFYYVPDGAGNPAPAYESVKFIMSDVYLGWLFRGVHFWAAQLLIIMVLLHMARVYWTGSYRAPRPRKRSGRATSRSSRCTRAGTDWSPSTSGCPSGPITSFTRSWWGSRSSPSSSARPAITWPTTCPRTRRTPSSRTTSGPTRS